MKLKCTNNGLTFFMQNGFEISISTFFAEAEHILNSGLAGKEDEII